jgi:hypothetical protein
MAMTSWNRSFVMPYTEAMMKSAVRMLSAVIFGLSLSAQVFISLAAKNKLHSREGDNRVIDG